MRKQRLWLLILIILGWGLRLTWLGDQSLWYDEGVTWLLSQMSLPDLIDWTAADIQPPLYYVLIWAEDILLGDSEWTLRFPSAVFSILTIPLIYVLALRLFAALGQRYLAALLAAAMFTFSPLMIYYSQEARMYTLLTFEASLSSYLLLKILHPGDKLPAGPATSPRSRPTGYALLFALTAAAALYTHYFALFLLTAQALYALYILWRQRFPRAGFIQLLLAFGGAVLLFAPWLPTLLARLGDDPSYWPGALKLDEVLRKLLISFIAGETIFEQTGWWLSLIFLGLWILAIGLPLVAKASGRLDRTATGGQQENQTRSPSYKAFLLLWLLLPLLLILGLAYQSPKFNPRYALVAWPAVALSLSITLAGLLKPQAAARTTIYLSRGLFVIVLLFQMGVTAYSLGNWFTDPRFSKDDFKALAQFVRERQAGDETVLLSSGHLFPVWAYYYDWEDWSPLPWMLRLDVNRITDLTIAADIAEAVDGYGGVWLVKWQDEIIDPNGVVPFWLDLIGHRPDDAGDFWGVGLEHWRLDPGKLNLLQENPIQRPVALGSKPGADGETVTASAADSPTSNAINFANQVDLLGFTQLSDDDLALFWRPRRPLPDELILTLNLTDRNGFDWSRETAIGRPGGSNYPPSRWPVDQIVVTRHHLPWQIGTPPGLYVAEIGLGTIDEKSETRPAGNVKEAVKEYSGWDVLDEQGRPERRTALLDFVNLSRLVLPDSGPLPMDDDPAVDFFPIIGLRRSILPQKTAQPGDRILLAQLWQAGEYNLDDVSVAFDLVDAAGETHRVGGSYTPSRRFNLPRWQPGDVVLGQYWLNVPPDVASGPAKLQLHLINVSGFAYDKVFAFAEIEILPSERSFSLPGPVDMPLEVDFSDHATLIGADCPDDCTAAPGEAVPITLYWRAGVPFNTNLTVFTHVLGPEETVVINADHAPPKPTLGWVTDEIIADRVVLSIPGDLPAGNYSIEVGLYNAAEPTFQRLPLTSGDTRLILPQPLTVQP